jgi:7-cyano-7-deazaguanine synthase
MKGLVLHSGGLDSTTLLKVAMDECDDVESLTILYGQKHEKEVDAAVEICRRFGVEHGVIEIPNIFKGYGSTLIDDDKPQPQMTYEELRESEGPSPTYVPFRNAIFLSMATARALVANADYVYFGAHADDAHNWAYPDCTPEFIGAMTNAVNVGTYYKTRLRSPFMWATKAEIVRIGTKLGVPFEATWSCYDGGELQCGVCPTCVSRKEAFRQAGIEDPTKYSR